MRVVNTVTSYMSPSFNYGLFSIYVNVEIPIGSKILNIFINDSILGIVFDCDLGMTVKENVYFNIINGDIVNFSNPDYMYVTTIMDINPQMVALNAQISISNNKKIYHVFKKATIDEKRDSKIEEIIDKK